jgi:hypothetical protein
MDTEETSTELKVSPEGHAGWIRLLLAATAISCANILIYLLIKSQSLASCLINMLAIALAAGAQACISGSKLYGLEGDKIRMVTERRRAQLFGITFRENFRFPNLWKLNGGMKGLLRVLFVVVAFGLALRFGDLIGLNAVAVVTGLLLAFAFLPDRLWAAILASAGFMVVGAHSTFGARNIVTMAVICFSGVEILAFSWYLSNRLDLTRFTASKNRPNKNFIQITQLTAAFLVIAVGVFLILPKDMKNLPKFDNPIKNDLTPDLFSSDFLDDPAPQTPGSEGSTTKTPGGQGNKNGSGKGPRGGAGSSSISQNNAGDQSGSPGSGGSSGGGSGGSSGGGSGGSSGGGSGGSSGGGSGGSSGGGSGGSSGGGSGGSSGGGSGGPSGGGSVGPSGNTGNAGSGGQGQTGAPVEGSSGSPGQKPGKTSGQTATGKNPDEFKDNPTKTSGGGSKPGSGRKTETKPGKGSNEKSGKPAPGQQPEKPKPEPKRQTYKTIMIVILAAALITLVILIARRLSRKKKRPEAEKSNRPKKTPAEIAAAVRLFDQECRKVMTHAGGSDADRQRLIIQLYDLLMKLYEECGIPKPDYFTPDEFDRNEFTYRPAARKALNYITILFNQTYYGQKSPGPHDVQTYQQAVMHLGNFLARTVRQTA